MAASHWLSWAGTNCHTDGLPVGCERGASLLQACHATQRRPPHHHDPRRSEKSPSDPPPRIQRRLLLDQLTERRTPIRPALPLRPGAPRSCSARNRHVTPTRRQGSQRSCARQGFWSIGMKGSRRRLVTPTVAEPPSRLRMESARKGGRQTFDRRNTNGQ